MSCKVLSHWWGESRGPQPGKRQAPATARSFVIFFIFDCHVNCWPPRDFFQLDPRVANITFCVKRLSSIRRTWPSHRRRVCWMISAKLLRVMELVKYLTSLTYVFSILSQDFHGDIESSLLEKLFKVDLYRSYFY